MEMESSSGPSNYYARALPRQEWPRVGFGGASTDRRCALLLRILKGKTLSLGLCIALATMMAADQFAMAAEADSRIRSALESPTDVEVSLRQSKVVAGPPTLDRGLAASESAPDFFLLRFGVRGKQGHPLAASYLIVDSAGRIAPEPLGPFARQLVSLQKLAGGRISVLVPSEGQRTSHPYVQEILLGETSLGLDIEEFLSIRTDVQDFGDVEMELSFPEAWDVAWSVSPTGRIGFLRTDVGGHVLSLQGGRIVDESWFLPAVDSLHKMSGFFSSGGQSLVVVESGGALEKEGISRFHILNFDDSGLLRHRQFERRSGARAIAMSQLGNHVAVRSGHGLEIVPTHDPLNSHPVLDPNRPVPGRRVIGAFGRGHPEMFLIVDGNSVAVWKVEDVPGGALSQELSLGTEQRSSLSLEPLTGLTSDGRFIVRDQKHPILYGVGWETPLPDFRPAEWVGSRAVLVPSPWGILVAQGVLEARLPRQVRLVVLPELDE